MARSVNVARIRLDMAISQAAMARAEAQWTAKRAS
jgi:hypothetical protein